MRNGFYLYYMKRHNYSRKTNIHIIYYVLVGLH